MYVNDIFIERKKNYKWIPNDITDNEFTTNNEEANVCSTNILISIISLQSLACLAEPLIHFTYIFFALELLKGTYRGALYQQHIIHV